MTETRDVDIAEVLRDARLGDLRALPEEPAGYDELHRATSALFDLLDERGVEYVLVGGLAVLQYVEGRNTRDIDLILSPNDLDRLPELELLSRDNDFGRAMFGGVQLDLLLTSNAVFETGRAKYSAALPFGPPNQAKAHLDGLVHVRAYAQNAGCTSNKDPVSVVFYQSADITNMHTHAHHHGSWSNHGGTTQYFWNHDCYPMDGQHANGATSSSRYHMRHFWNIDPAEPWLGAYSIATPHYETIDLNCSWWFDPNHKVTNGYPGGFVIGKWEIGYRWHNWNGVYGGSPGQHLWLENQYWDNRDPIPQCEGTAANDGWVDFVRIVGSGH